MERRGAGAHRLGVAGADGSWSYKALYVPALIPFFLVSDLHKTANVFDVPSGWAMGFDTSVLMASLLANVGVRTQLVDVPGHLFLLVDTGIHERNRLAMTVDEGLYVVAGLALPPLAQFTPASWRTGGSAGIPHAPFDRHASSPASR